MLKRLLMALLIMCLAAPAMAMPVAQPSTMPGMEHCHQAAPAQSLPPQAHHDCIGCIASYAGAPKAPDRLPFPALPPMALAGRALPITSLAPDTPPPRI